MPRSASASIAVPYFWASLCLANALLCSWPSGPTQSASHRFAFGLPPLSGCRAVLHRPLSCQRSRTLATGDYLAFVEVEHLRPCHGELAPIGYAHPLQGGLHPGGQVRRHVAEPVQPDVQLREALSVAHEPIRRVPFLVGGTFLPARACPPFGELGLEPLDVPDNLCYVAQEGKRAGFLRVLHVVGAQRVCLAAGRQDDAVHHRLVVGYPGCSLDGVLFNARSDMQRLAAVRGDEQQQRWHAQDVGENEQLVDGYLPGGPAPGLQVRDHRGSDTRGADV